MKLVRLLIPLLTCSAHAAPPLVLENAHIRRTFTTTDGTLRTAQITNRLTGATITPDPCPEFLLRLSRGTDSTDPDTLLSSTDFQVTGHHRLGDDATRTLAFDLAAPDHGLQLSVRYSLAPEATFLRKSITITSERPWVLERIDIEALGISDAYQPYTKDAITSLAPGNWSPNLGQPLFTRRSGVFWGVEFPAARNQVDDGSLLRAGYLRGLPLEPGKPYLSHAAVCGVADDPAFVADAFFDYIDRIRIRPLRLQTQYNSWFDLLSSPLADSIMDLPESAAFGDQLTLRLAPREIRLLHFDRNPRDWSSLRALQARSPEPEPVDLTGHPVLGTWSYRHGGVPHTRTFTADGKCTLRAGEEVQWTKPFDAVSDKLLVVQGGLRHEIQADGTMRIENRYTARR